jgi:hypothetical protein
MKPQSKPPIKQGTIIVGLVGGSAGRETIGENLGRLERKKKLHDEEKNFPAHTHAAKNRLIIAPFHPNRRPTRTLSACWKRAFVLPPQIPGPTLDVQDARSCWYAQRNLCHTGPACPEPGTTEPRGPAIHARRGGTHPCVRCGCPLEFAPDGVKAEMTQMRRLVESAFISKQI